MDLTETPLMRKIKEIENALDSAHIVVGWIDGNGSAQTAYAHLQAKAETGEDQPSVGKPPSLALIARTLNYGREPGVTAGGRKYGRIPARPFMTFAVEIWEKVFPKILERFLPMVLSGRMSVDMLFKQIGARATQTVRDAIKDGDYVPLSPRTIAAKGSSTPLIDTGKMIGSVSYEIRRD